MYTFPVKHEFIVNVKCRMDWFYGKPYVIICVHVFNFLKQSSSANGTVKFYPTHTEIPWLVIIYNAEAKIENHLIRKRSVMNQFNIEVDWPNSLVHSLHSSRALNLTVDRFQTNNTLIYSHGLSYNCSPRAVTLFLQISGGECTRARVSGETAKREKRGQQPEISSLAPSVTSLVIWVSRAFCSTD